MAKSKVRTRAPGPVRKRLPNPVDTTAIEAARKRLRDLDAEVVEIMGDLQAVRLEFDHKVVVPLIRTKIIAAEVQLGIAVDHLRTIDRRG